MYASPVPPLPAPPAAPFFQVHRALPSVFACQRRGLCYTLNAQRMPNTLVRTFLPLDTRATRTTASTAADRASVLRTTPKQRVTTSPHSQDTWCVARPPANNHRNTHQRDKQNRSHPHIAIPAHARNAQHAVSGTDKQFGVKQNRCGVKQFGDSSLES
jgi:hypothetical protein